MLPFPSIELLLLTAAALLFLSVVASKVSDRLGIPALAIFLLIGMLAGSEGIGGIHFDDPWLAKSLGITALIFIIFSGGIETKYQDIRSVAVSGILLSSIGVVLTALIVGVFAFFILKFSFVEAFLLGAIVSSTDAAAVFSVLRSRSVSLQGKIRPLLELESGSNDPIAVILTVSIIRFLLNDQLPVLNFIPALIWEIAFGILMGVVMGRIMRIVINRVQLSYEGLYSALTISLVVITYGLTAVLKGNGFIAVYLASLVLGNSLFLHKKTIIQFHEALAWLMQIVMFLTLGLLVFPSRLVPIVGAGLIASLILMFVARPVSVFLCLSFSKFKWREKCMVAWVGLRGAVPIILATFPLIAKTPNADMIFNVVFFIVLTSVLLQGTSIPTVAKWLKVDAPISDKRIYPIAMEYTEGIDASLEELIVPYNATVVGKKIFELDTPEGCLIVLICRDEKFSIPKGTTVLEAGDVLLTLGKKDDIQKFQKIFFS
jgi:cell volume regulation protein A